MALQFKEVDSNCWNCGSYLDTPLSEEECRAIANTYLGKAQIAFDRGKGLRRALFNCDKALEFLPQSAEAHNLKGLIYDDMGKLVKAILEYKEAVRLEPEYEDAVANLQDAEAERASTIPDNLGRH